MEINKKIAVLVFAVATLQLTAMQSNKKNEHLWETAKNGDYDKAKGLIEQGANPNFIYKAGLTPLMVAAFSYRPDMVKLLIEHGADVFMYEPFDMRSLVGQRTALMIAARAICNEEQAMAQLPERTVYALLTNIPLEERKKILQMKEDINQKRDAAQAALLQVRPVVPRDIRKMIMQRLLDEPINELVTNQMARVTHMLTQKSGDQLISGDQLTAQDFAKASKTECGAAIARIVDPNDVVEQEEIRKMIRNNVKRILFGEPSEATLFKMSEVENENKKKKESK